jgi:hypothetical protein
MNRRLSIVLTDESWEAVARLRNEARQGFRLGSINYSDVINEMIQTSKVDLKALQAKHMNLQKSLKTLATQADIDVDSVIKFLTEMKGRDVRKLRKPSAAQEIN